MKVEFEMETVTCARCEVAIVASPGFMKRRREDHEGFYCLNGHNNYFPGKSEAEKLREKLEENRRHIVQLESELAKANAPRKRGRPRKY